MAKSAQTVQNHDIVSNIMKAAEKEKAPARKWHSPLFIWGSRSDKYADAQDMLIRYADIYVNGPQMARDIKKEKKDLPYNGKDNAAIMKKLKKRWNAITNNLNNLTFGIQKLESAIKLGENTPDAYLLLGAAYVVSNELPKAHAVSLKLGEMKDYGQAKLLASMIYYGAYIVVHSSSGSDYGGRIGIFHKGKDSEEQAHALMNGTPLPQAFIDLQNICKFKTRMFD